MGSGFPLWVWGLWCGCGDAADVVLSRVWCCTVGVVAGIGCIIQHAVSGSSCGVGQYAWCRTVDMDVLWGSLSGSGVAVHAPL